MLNLAESADTASKSPTGLVYLLIYFLLEDHRTSGVSGRKTHSFLCLAPWSSKKPQAVTKRGRRNGQRMWRRAGSNFYDNNRVSSKNSGTTHVVIHVNRNYVIFLMGH